MNKTLILAIAAFALMIAISANAQTIYDSITCTNCILDNPTFLNFSFPVSNLTNSSIQINETQVTNLTTDLNNKWNKTDLIPSDNLKVNKSGDIMVGNLTVISKKIFVGNTDFDYVATEDINVVNTGKGSSFRLESDIGTYFFGARYRGSHLSPTKILTNDILFVLSGIGMKPDNNYSSSASQISFVAKSNFENDSTAGMIIFQTTANGTTTIQNRGLINDTGYFGFNTINPQRKFHSVGSMRFASLDSNLVTNDAVCRNTTTGDIFYNSGLPTCTVSTETSKTNITYISNNLTLSVLNMKVATYNEIGSKKLRYGLIAEDLKLIYPDMIGYYGYDVDDGNGSSKYYQTTNITGINYEQLIPVLIKTIQEQQTTINKICKNSPNLCK